MDLVHLIKWYSTKPVFQSPRGVLGGAGLPTNTTGYTSLPDQFLSHPLLCFREHLNNSALLLPSIGHPSSRTPPL